MHGLLQQAAGLSRSWKGQNLATFVVNGMCLLGRF